MDDKVIEYTVEYVASVLPDNLILRWSALNINRRQFIVEYMKDKNQTRAARVAGFSAKSATVTGSRLVRDRNVAPILKYLVGLASKQGEADIEWLINQARENYQRCMKAIPVTDDKGKSIGEWKYEPAQASKYLDMIAKFQGYAARGAGRVSDDKPGDNKYAETPPEPKSIGEWVIEMTKLGYYAEEDEDKSVSPEDMLRIMKQEET